MPNRILKESICTSDDINDLSSEQEVFFYRLIVNCDDYGRFDGRPEILRSRLYQLRLDKVKTKDIEAMLGVLVAKKMVQIYMHDGKQYLQLVNWSSHQQMRAKKSKYPAPDINGLQTPPVDNSSDNNGYHMISDDCICPRESESESESESRNIVDVVDAYNSVCVSLPKVQQVTDKRKKAVKSRLTEFGYEKLCNAFHLAEESEFLSGRSGKWTNCNFDWLMNRENIVKVLEGTYNKEPTAAPMARGKPYHSSVIEEFYGGDGREHQRFDSGAEAGGRNFKAITGGVP